MAATHSVAETLLSALQTSIVKDVCSKWGFESELEDLKVTISNTRKLLLDAEAKQELADETGELIQKLTDAVYDADDLFDELITVANQHKGRLRGDKLFEKVRKFFSNNDQLIFTAHTMAQWVKTIMNQLDSMVSSDEMLSFKVDYEPIREKGRDEIYSYLDERNVVIGREEDMNTILDFVFNPRFDNDVSFINIVGERGLGKTTLARLVFNDERVVSEFHVRLWVDFSGRGEETLKANVILGKILESCGRFYTEVDSLLQYEMPQQLGGKKYLLVLDDLCIEDHQEWLVLRKFLMWGDGGSRIIVTTNSKETARVIGNEHTYELKGLSKENSRRLFELAAFGKEKEHVSYLELMEVGKTIVEQCCGFPLALKEVGSHLFGQDVSMWRLFEKLDKGEDKILLRLYISYRSLDFPLKSCLSYCAMFPRGFIIKKNKLLGLWMAQGYIVPPGGQSMEDVAEDYFLILLRRCLLQPVQRNEYGEVVSCKIHSIMRDVAVEVAPQVVCVVGSIEDNLGENIRHLHHVGDECSESSFPNKTKIRSYVHDIFDRSIPPLDKIVSSWMCLKALDLHEVNIEKLPESIGKLLHLRYLDLSLNHLKRLPNSITKLCNLQSLNLDGCTSFEELPRDLSKLVKLRSLNINECYGMMSMPSGLDKLTCLHSLTAFIVARESITEEESSSEDDSSSARTQLIGMLKDLKGLINLRGSIKITIPTNFKNVDDDHSLDGCNGGYLGGMKHLQEVKVDFADDYCDKAAVNHESLLEKLHPHPNLKGLELWRYQGSQLPRWASCLPNLVKIKIDSCGGLSHLSLLSVLQFLKSLIVSRMSNLEYMEEPKSNISGSKLTFFPSLVYLSISYMPELKAWSKDINDGSCFQQSFSSLRDLSLTDCCKLTSFPPCPRLKNLYFGGLHENFKILEAKDGSCSNGLLKKVTVVRNITHLNSLPTCSLTSLHIIWDDNVERLSKVREAFRSFSSSLRSLKIQGCENLISVSGALEYLTSLESLSIIECPSLVFSNEEDSMPWRPLNQSLRSLELWRLDNMEILPKGMQFLTTLQSLIIECCWEFKALPEWISCLSSLKALRVKCCDQFQSLPETMRNLTSLRLLEMSYCEEGLKGRCENPNGVDWPKIQHIPSIMIFT